MSTDFRCPRCARDTDEVNGIQTRLMCLRCFVDSHDYDNLSALYDAIHFKLEELRLGSTDRL